MSEPEDNFFFPHNAMLRRGKNGSGLGHKDNKESDIE